MKEGDSLRSRIVRLSWQGGLTSREMANLKWSDISLPAATWSIEGKARPIPADLAQVMRQWNSAQAEYVLTGERSGTRLDTAFLTRKASDFFSEYAMEQLSLKGLCGQYGKPQPENLKEEILRKTRERGRTNIVKFAETMNVPKVCVVQALWELEEEGALSRASGTAAYHPAQEQTPWNRLKGILAKHQESGEPLTLSEVCTRLNLSPSHANYYLNRACAQGMIEKTGRGLYLTKSKKEPV